jgi:hypothetical protein
MQMFAMGVHFVVMICVAELQLARDALLSTSRKYVERRSTLLLHCCQLCDLDVALNWLLQRHFSVRC